MITQYYPISKKFPEQFEKMVQAFTGPQAQRIQAWALKRQTQYWAARVALQQSLCLLGFEITQMEQLEIINHHHLALETTHLVSLAHTDHMAVALVAPTSEEIGSVGIDIERVTRSMSPGVEQFFVNAQDDVGRWQFQELCRTELLLWVMKEAAFKALWPFRQVWGKPDLVLKDLWIDHNCFGLQGQTASPHPIGRVEVCTVSYQGEHFLVATASAKDAQNCML